MKSSFKYFILSLLFLSGCKECVQDKVADLSFTPEEQAIIPYSAGDTLVFENQNHDSLTFIFKKKVLTQYRGDEFDPETAKFDKNGCSGNYVEADHELIVLKNTFDSLQGIQIILDFLYRFNRQQAIKVLV